MAEKRRAKNEDNATPKWKVREDREAQGLGEAFDYETLED